jgi:hypothetical protein
VENWKYIYIYKVSAGIDFVSEGQLTQSPTVADGVVVTERSASLLVCGEQDNGHCDLYETGHGRLLNRTDLWPYSLVQIKRIKICQRARFKQRNWYMDGKTLVRSEAFYA